LLQHIEFAQVLVSTFWQIFHPLAGFVTIFSHKVSHRRLPQTDGGAFIDNPKLQNYPALSLFVIAVNVQSDLNIFITRHGNIFLGAGDYPGLAAFARAKILIHLNLDNQFRPLDSHIYILSHYSCPPNFTFDRLPEILSQNISQIPNHLNL
jgi:hypothetical protein